MTDAPLQSVKLGIPSQSYNVDLWS